MGLARGMLPMIKCDKKPIVSSVSFSLFRVQQYTRTTAVNNNIDSKGAWALIYWTSVEGPGPSIKFLPTNLGFLP